MRRIPVVVVAGVALALVACSPHVQNAGLTTSADLARLTVRADGPMNGYSRDQFGAGWASGESGCDTRQRILRRDGRDVRMNGACRVEGGVWTSPYDDASITVPSRVQIDHVVPLADAWRSGAAGWSRQRRVELANNTDELLAVSATSNEAKGDKTPDRWKPPAHAYWCAYAGRYVAVKVAYELTVTMAERNALGQMLSTCTP